MTIYTEQKLINKSKKQIIKRTNNQKKYNKTKINKKIKDNNIIDIVNMNPPNNSSSQDYTLLKQKPNKQWVYKYYRDVDDDTILAKKSKDKLKDKSTIKRCMCINYQDINDFKSYDRCNKQAIQGTDFCELHQECKSYLRNFLSGSEPEYKPELWSDPYVEGSHNCYSYFLNRQVKAVKEKCNEICEKKYKFKLQSSCPQKESECIDLKPQPGDFDIIKKTGSDKNKERIYQCPNMQKKILLDNPSLIPVAFNKKCPANYYKGSLLVDPENTFHFMRQDKSGLFTHKPGISKVTDKDASGNKIYIPHFADRNYEADENNDEAINYTDFCGYYCVPQNHIVHKNLA